MSADLSPGQLRPDAPAISGTVSATFEAFCAANLWPGMSKVVREKLAVAGIRGPADVTEDALAAIPGLSAKRAATLMINFARARPAYDVVALLLPADLPARLAGGALASLGPGAASVLADDPWRLLDGGEADLRQADRLAGQQGRGRTEPARGPAVLVHLLMLAARNGDTAMSARGLVASAAGRGVPDPSAALTSALDAGRVLAGLDEAPAVGVLPDPDRLIALPRYAIAEEALAGGMARLTAAAAPIGEPDTLGLTGLDDAQLAAVAAALANGVSLLTGGPGHRKEPHRLRRRPAGHRARRNRRPGRSHRTRRETARGAHRSGRQHRPSAARRPAGTRGRPQRRTGLHPQRELAAGP